MNLYGYLNGEWWVLLIATIGFILSVVKLVKDGEVEFDPITLCMVFCFFIIGGFAVAQIVNMYNAMIVLGR